MAGGGGESLVKLSREFFQQAWVIGALAVLLGLNVGFTIWWNQVQVDHSCAALNILVSHPVKAPADPAANPSRETTYQFYQALRYWDYADGCQ